VLFIAFLAVQYGQWADSGGDPVDAPRPITTPAEAVSKEPYVWDVSLDPTGRPYDVELTPGDKVERRPLAVLHAPSRRVLFLGGEYLPNPEIDHNASLATLGERKGRRYPVDAIWTISRDGYESIVGVVIVERDTPIVRWEELDSLAYGTDAGLGGITTAEWAALPEDERRPHERSLIDFQGKAGTFDIDGRPGTDTIWFDNGYGDGGFPSIAGYDASGARAAIAIWSIIVPWRLGFPEGTPPAQVTQRENRFAACLAGRRKLEGSTCRTLR
jgi:hypothetical protein